MSPLSTNANLCRLLILPSGECSRAGMMYHSVIARGSEFGVADSRFGRRCSTMAWLGMPSTWTLMRACAPANCGCTFFPVAKRCCRPSKETVSIPDYHVFPSGNVSFMFHSDMSGILQYSYEYVYL